MPKRNSKKGKLERMVKSGKPIMVKWYDACSRQFDNEMLESLSERKSGKDLLAINKSYGRILKVYDDVVVQAYEESTVSPASVSIIPRVCIISPGYLKSKNWKL